MQTITCAKCHGKFHLQCFEKKMLIKELVLHKKLVRQPKQNNEVPEAKEDSDEEKLEGSDGLK